MNPKQLRGFVEAIPTDLGDESTTGGLFGPVAIGVNVDASEARKVCRFIWLQDVGQRLGPCSAGVPPAVRRASRPPPLRISRLENQAGVARLSGRQACPERSRRDAGATQTHLLDRDHHQTVGRKGQIQFSVLQFLDFRSTRVQAASRSCFSCAIVGYTGDPIFS